MFKLPASLTPSLPSSIPQYQQVNVNLQMYGSSIKTSSGAVGFS